MIREKRTSSGPLFEADFYPVWDDGRKLPTRAPKSKPTSAAQARYNDLIAKKKVVRLVNVNFDQLDYFGHLTYKATRAPQNEAQARKDIRNFLRRVKRHRERALEVEEKRLAKAKGELARIPDSEFLKDEISRIKETVRELRRPFKYIYAIEKTTYQSGCCAGKCNWHFHMIVTGGISVKAMQDIWGGDMTKMDPFRPDLFGPEAAALYITKDPQGRKRFAYSKNLKKPKELKHRDGKLTKGKVERLCKERIDDRQYWENRYKGYRFVRCYPRFNEWNGHWYLTVIMYKSDRDPPKWEEVDEWNTEIGA